MFGSAFISSDIEKLLRSFSPKLILVLESIVEEFSNMHSVRFCLLKQLIMFLQIPLFGGLQPLCPIRKDIENRCVAEEGVFLGLQNGTHSRRYSFTAQAMKAVSGSFVSQSEQGYLTDTWGHLQQVGTDPHYSLSDIGELKYIERYNLSTVPEETLDFAKESTEGFSTLVVPAQPENFASLPSSISADNESLASTKASVGDLVAGINESFNASVNKGENALRSSLDTATSFIDSIVNNATKSADNAFSKAFSAVDQSGEVANKKFTSFSSELSGVTNKAPALAVDALRRAIIAAESSLASGASYVVYLYGSAKELLPAGIRDTVNVYEDKATEILRPVGSATQKVTFCSLIEFQSDSYSESYLILSLNFPRKFILVNVCLKFNLNCQMSCESNHPMHGWFFISSSLGRSLL